MNYILYSNAFKVIIRKINIDHYFHLDYTNIMYYWNITARVQKSVKTLFKIKSNIFKFVSSSNYKVLESYRYINI